MNLVLATTNQGKAREMQQFFAPLKNFTWHTLADHPPITEPEEHGTTFEANAELKAQYYGKKLQTPVIAEDSGLILEAFPDKFGLRTRRQIDAKDDHEWLDKFLELLRHTDNRHATFYSAIAYFDPLSKTLHTVLGQSSGEIVDFPQAPIEPGIPVSSVFLPENADEVFAAMTREQKNQVSHRGRAAAQMLNFLSSQT